MSELLRLAELPENLTELFEYLDGLRESGETNMFGAAPYLGASFGFDRDTSGRVLRAWMKTFDHETSAEDRATRAREATNAS